MGKKLKLLSLFLAITASLGVFAVTQRVYADAGDKCLVVIFGQIGPEDCGSAAIKSALPANYDIAANTTNGEQACWTFFPDATGSVKVSNTNCAEAPFGAGTATVTCADGVVVSGPKGTSPEEICRDHSGYLSSSAECFEGKLVEARKEYTKVNCTAAWKTINGIKSINDSKCYMVDTSDPVFKGEMNCDEARKKTQGANNSPAVPPGQINPGSVASCPQNTEFFGFPTWYKYLPPGPNCAIDLNFDTAPNQLWLIALAIADMLLRVAGLIAVLFVIKGGYQYITSQFDPEGTKKAKDDILNALIGLVIAVLSTAIVNFLGNALK